MSTVILELKESGSKAQPLPKRASAVGGKVGLVRLAVVEHGALFAVRVGPLARLLQRELKESVSQSVITRLRVRVGVGVRDRVRDRVRVGLLQRELGEVQVGLGLGLGLGWGSG